MADEVDIANDYAERFIEHSLAQHKERAKDEESEFYCTECGDVIPHRRRAAIKGVKTCVDCQNLKERSL
ncbi:MAG: TraR/DksA family transcriptional regulator [Candidatus Methanomethylicaceae archaeon]